MASVEFHSKLMNLQHNMLSFALMLTSNRKNAYDLVQDTTLRAINEEAAISEGGNFKGWMFSLMRSIFMSSYRKQRTRAAVSVAKKQPKAVTYNISVSHVEALGRPEGSVSEKQLFAIIADFSEEYRVPFSMHLTGYRYEEIATHLGITEREVRNRVTIARRKMQSQLADYR